MRVGFNPNKDQVLSKSEFTHQVIVPVYIPHQKDYFKDSFQILQWCLESLFKTSHAKTFFTVVNNGSCAEVVAYLNQLHHQYKIHEVIHTTAIGKLNAILKGLTGHQFPLITITDADVLFLNNWQKATYEVFEAFPKAGAVSTTPSSKVLKQHTSNIVTPFVFSHRLRFDKVLDPKAMSSFADSIGNSNFYKAVHLTKYLTLSNRKVKAVIGAGHFVATYRGSVFEALSARYTTFALGGLSEGLFLDKPINDRGYWRLSTVENYTYHLGNRKEHWMDDAFEKIVLNDVIEDFELAGEVKISKFQIFFNKFFFRVLLWRPIWKLFLRKKGLTKEEANQY